MGDLFLGEGGIFAAVDGGTFGKETNFRKKVSQCRNTERVGPLGLSNIHSDAKQQKN